MKIHQTNIGFSLPARPTAGSGLSRLVWPVAVAGEADGLSGMLVGAGVRRNLDINPPFSSGTEQERP